MHRKISIIVLSLFLIVAFSTYSLAAKVPAPEKGGEGFKAVSLQEAKKLVDEGAVVIACHSHTTDYLKGHIQGAIHITVMVAKPKEEGEIIAAATKERMKTAAKIIVAIEEEMGAAADKVKSRASTLFRARPL